MPRGSNSGCEPDPQPSPSRGPRRSPEQLRKPGHVVSHGRSVSEEKRAMANRLRSHVRALLHGWELSRCGGSQTVTGLASREEPSPTTIATRTGRDARDEQRHSATPRASADAAPVTSGPPANELGALGPSRRTDGTPDRAGHV